MRPAVLNAPLLAAAILAAGPARAADISGEAALVSDYRYRGVSLSDRKPAVQGSLDLDFKTGTYVELWGSTIADDGAGHVELDAMAGHAFELTESLSLDVSATAYLYPGGSSANALEFTATLERSMGPLTANVSASLAPTQRGTRDDDGNKAADLYLSSEIEYQIGETPLSFHAGFGREKGAWDMRDTGAKFDWKLGLGAEWERARLALDFVGSNAGSDGVVGELALRF